MVRRAAHTFIPPARSGDTTQPANAPAAKWRVSPSFILQRERPAGWMIQSGLEPFHVYRSGSETQFGFRFHWCGRADDPPKLPCDAIQYRALFLHPL
jgi:hypothetical protein